MRCTPALPIRHDYGIDTPVYTQITYDGLSRLTVTTFPDTGQATTSYQGLVKQVQDPRQHTTIYTYDVYQRLKATQDAYGTITQYGYDTLGNLVQVIAASGQTEENTTTMTYDSLSEKRNMTDPDMGTWSYTYDPDMGRLSTLVTQKLDSGTPVATYQNLAYAYDLKGNITTSAFFP